MNVIPESCATCPYTYEVQRKFGYTKHCKMEPTHMDISHVDGRSLLCPLRPENGRGFKSIFSTIDEFDLNTISILKEGAKNNENN